MLEFIIAFIAGYGTGNLIIYLYEKIEKEYL